MKRPALRASLFLPLALAFLPACSSWINSLKASLGGDEEASTTAAATPPEASRAPASNGRAISIDSGSGTDYSKIARPADPSGPDLAKNEFAAQSRTGDDRAAHGFRRQADPWDGTGPVNEGSLWNPDSQDNFYFSKNLLHKVGDILIVKVEPEVNDAFNTRISSLMPSAPTVRQVASTEAGNAVAAQVGAKASQATGNANVGNALGQAVGSSVATSLAGPATKYVDIEEIPVHIIETLPRNSFKVEGTRRVMIKNAPYQVKISGVIRDEDIGPQAMIASSKVIDSKMELTR